MGQGYSDTNLKQMRKFYQVYANDQIGQMLSDQSQNLPTVSTGNFRQNIEGILYPDRNGLSRFRNNIDLVFYNRLLQCFVLFDLKLGDLTHQDLGQMQMYVNYYDRYEKTPEENPTVGIFTLSGEKRCAC